jgi:hypothetical protein
VRSGIKVLLKQERTDLFSFKAGHLIKNLKTTEMRQILEILVTFISCVFFVILLKTRLFPAIPEPETIPASEPIPASKRIPVVTPATTNEMEYASSWLFLWRSLPENRDNLLRILALPVPGLINILI